MSRSFLLISSLCLSHILLSQESDSLYISQQKFYFNIEMGNYSLAEEEPANKQLNAPLNTLKHKSLIHFNKRITVNDKLKNIDKECDVLRKIKNPYYSSQSHSYFKITAIEIKECSTVLYFKVKVRNQLKFKVPKGSCIFPDRSEPVFIQAVEGNISMEKCTNKTTSYKAIFPPIPIDTQSIDFRELNKGGDWYTIGLKVGESKHH